MKTISNSDDIIDSRDVIERIEELQGERTTLVEEMEERQSEANTSGKEDDLEALETAKTALEDWDADNKSELDALVDLQEEAEGYSEDWPHGATLIRDSYFKDYAMELADDIGAIPKDATWPCSCIDWDQAARELQMDYTSVSFDGVDYWIR